MLVTAADMQRSLIRYMGADNDEQAVIHSRISIMDAMKEVWSRYDWPYYMGQATIRTDAPYSTGTITYVASTRLMTLAGSTFPTWAIYGTVIVGNKRARITRRVSDTVVLIEEGTAFVDNIASATTYTLYRAEYPIPDNIRKVSYPSIEEAQFSVLKYVPTLEFRTRNPGTVGSMPQTYTVQKDRSMQQNVMCFWPYPSTAVTIRYNYVRMPAPVDVWSVTAGKLTVVADSSDVVGSSTAFEDLHEGCLLRIGRDANNVPTPRHGMYPYSDELLIDTVADATNLTTLTAINTSRANVRFEISSLLDVEDAIMSSLFTLQCYYELGKHRKMVDKDQIIVSRQLELALKNAKSKANPTSEIIYAGNNIAGQAFGQVWIVIG